jgi:aryl-alcohol dehydrogenase-like predicted oxidoreductase
MKYKTLGKSGIKVSEIGFGAWTIGLDWWGKKIEDDEAKRMLKKAYDVGINFFETADMYGKGKSEKLIGEVFKGMRDEIVISSKYGYDFSNVEQIGHTELPQHFDKKFTEKALDASLERLQTKYIDSFGMHNPKIDQIRNNEPFETFDKLIQEGKMKTTQIALGPAIGWTQEGLEAMDRDNVSSVQTVYNILEQTPGNDLRVPDASGILTGKVKAETVIPSNDHRKDRKMQWRQEALKKVEQFRPIAERNGMTITEFAIKFILTKNAIASVLPTVVSEEEIEAFAVISDGNYINSSDMKEIEDLYNTWPEYELKATPQTN